MSSRSKVYLLTGGLVPLLENRHNISLSDEVKLSLRLTEQYYFSVMRDLIGQREEKDEQGSFLWEMKFISDREIDSNLRSLISKNRGTNPIISFDDIYCPDLPDGNYNVTRIQNPFDLNESPTLGPRFKSPSLNEQVEQIKEKYRNKIDIMDVGTFGGEIIGNEIENRFRKNGIEVEKVYLAITGEKGLDRLKKLEVEVKYSEKFDWTYWVEMRDCFGFDGRKVPMRRADKLDNLFIKYSENPGWTGIPDKFAKEYILKYDSFFKTIKSILARDGIKVELKPSKRNKIIHELTIKGNKDEN